MTPPGRRPATRLDGMSTQTRPTAFSEKGRRGTRQRRVMRACLEDSDAFMSAQDIHDKLRHSGSPVALSTVYRTLQAMSEAGELDVLRSPEGEAVYRMCGSEHHHHHLVCRQCGRTVEVSGRGVEEWAEQAARENGFVSVTHQVELSGLCSHCANTAEPAQS